MVFAFRSALPAFLLVALALALAGCEGPSTDSPPDPGTVAGWDHYGNDTGGARHSLADQITPENVGELEVAWTFNTGDLITEEDLLAVFGRPERCCPAVLQPSEPRAAAAADGCDCVEAQ